MKSSYVRLIIEFVAWTIFLGFPLLFLPSLLTVFGEVKMKMVIRGVLFTHGYLIAFYYFNYFFALPRFYFQKRYGIYYLIVGSLLLLLLLVMNNEDYSPLALQQFTYGHTVFIFSIVVRFLMVFLLSLGLSAYSRYREAEEEKVKTELSFLKSQINPHFLFNTLNSIYALTVKKSDSAPESVTRLASIMRYVISDAAQDFVHLEKEMKYVQDYVDLEKLRLTSRVKLSYELSGDPSGLQIAPLIFIPLIENAFKHGVSTTEDSSISISTQISAGRLTVHVKNTKVKAREKTQSNGLGIDNMKKRLKLLYAGKHRLEIDDQAKEFSAKLELRLA